MSVFKKQIMMQEKQMDYGYGYAISIKILCAVPCYFLMTHGSFTHAKARSRNSLSLAEEHF